jgi:hypothetical protein
MEFCDVRLANFSTVLVSAVVSFFKEKIHPALRSAHVSTSTGTRSTARRSVKDINGTGKFVTGILGAGFVLFSNASVPVPVHVDRIFFLVCRCFLMRICTGMLPVL